MFWELATAVVNVLYSAMILQDFFTVGATASMQKV